MNPIHRMVRERLKKATRTEYRQMILEAKLTPVQTSVLRYHIVEGMTVIETSMKLNCSERTVAGILQKSYDKISQVC
jgi:DNA-binding NarL/FixJ family response regulator